MTVDFGNLVPPASDTHGAPVSVEDVRMEYATATGPISALDGVTLHVEPGRRLAIVGPRGCGKSPLLGILAGLEQPTAGRVGGGGKWGQRERWVVCRGGRAGRRAGQNNTCRGYFY